jgi:N6-adenosine-specific RNA methylase IME4
VEKSLVAAPPGSWEARMTAPLKNSGASAVAIDRIIIGERHRKDFGDIDGLAENIEEIGLLHPVVIRPDGRLVAGARRIVALKKLGRTTIPVTIIDLDKVVRGEYAENTFRKNLTLSEAADVADAIEPLERAAARKRQQASLKKGDQPPVRGISPDGKGRALDKVAKVVGKDRKTIQKARAVRDAAKADPEKFGKLKDDMDRSGRADGPYRRLSNLRQAAAIKDEPPPLPNRGPYRVIVADPPWPHDPTSDDPAGRGIRPYPEMTIDAICRLRVGGITPKDIAHEDAILWLWTTNYHMPFAYRVIEAWGFEPRTILTWTKDRAAYGLLLRNKTEHCIMAVRGKPLVILTNQTTELHAPVRAHSQKPEEFYTLVESLCPAPRYAYLFSREQRERWDMHGDEVQDRGAASSARKYRERHALRRDASVTERNARPKACPRRQYPEAFEVFWKAYPTECNMSKKEAYTSWKRMSPEQREAAVASLPAFRKYCEANPDYPIIHACRYLSKERFEGFMNLTTKFADQTFVVQDTPQWQAWQNHLIETRGKGSPSTQRKIDGRLVSGWDFESEWPPTLDRNDGERAADLFPTHAAE